jgi:hypothetical protein
MRMPDKNNNKFRAIPIFFAFLSMGFGDVVISLINRVKESFGVSTFQAQLMTFSGFIMIGFAAYQLPLFLGFVVLMAALLYIIFTTLQAARN